jgi:hypothetical protein
MTDRPSDASVLEGLQPFQWSSIEAVAYEAAIEAINGVVGAYSARIAVEETKPDPDAEAIARWESAQAECARRREELDPTDHETIAEVRRSYADRRRTIREGRG